MSIKFRTINEVDYLGRERTVLVFGCGRGGTSALAGGLRELGVTMPNAHPLKHEWSPLDGAQDPDWAAVHRTISAMNQQHDIWGWKSPKDVFSADILLSKLLNPVVVVVVRNIVDVGESMLRHSAIEFEIGFGEAVKAYEGVANFISQTPYPAIVLTYERLLEAPREFFHFANEWIGLSASEPQIDAAAEFVSSARGYAKLSTVDVDHRFSQLELDNDQVGAIEATYPGVISSYARSISALEKSMANLYSALGHHRDQLFAAAKTRCDAIGLNLEGSVLYQLYNSDRETFADILKITVVDDGSRHTDLVEIGPSVSEFNSERADSASLLTAERIRSAALCRDVFFRIKSEFVAIRFKQIALQKQYDEIVERCRMLAAVIQ